MNTETDERVAIKVLDKEKIQKQNMGAQIKKEISIMKMVRHKHVVVLKEVLASRTKVGENALVAYWTRWACQATNHSRSHRSSSCWSSSRAASCLTRSSAKDGASAARESSVVEEGTYTDQMHLYKCVSRFSEDTARFYFRQLVDGVLYCHQNGVCHRDLKPGASVFIISSASLSCAY